MRISSLSGAQRHDAQRLRLAAREQRRAVRARRDADLDRDVADLVLGAAVGALLVDGDALADDRLLELVERELDRRAALLGGLRFVLGGALGRCGSVLLEDRAPRRPWTRPGARACPRPAWPRRAPTPCEARIASSSRSGRPRIASNDCLLLAGLLGQLALQRAQLLDRARGRCRARRGSPPRGSRWRRPRPSGSPPRCRRRRGRGRRPSRRRRGAPPRWG